MSQPHQSCDRKPSHLNTSVSSLGLCGWRWETGDVTRAGGEDGQQCPTYFARCQTGSTRRSESGVSVCIDALSTCRSVHSQRLMPRPCVSTSGVLVSLSLCSAGKVFGLRKMSAGRKHPRERNLLPFADFDPTAHSLVLHLSGFESNGPCQLDDALIHEAAPAGSFPQFMSGSSGSAVSLSPNCAWDGARRSWSSGRSISLTSV